MVLKPPSDNDPPDDGDDDLPDPGVLSPMDPDPIAATDEFWARALNEARQLGPLPQPILFQGPADPLHSAEEAVTRLRDELSRCVMTFPRKLAVRALTPDDRFRGWRAWCVDIPLTLFPSRDRGFTLVDIAIQFETRKPRSLQLIKLAPEHQTRSLGRIVMSTEISIAASRRRGVPLADAPDVATVAQVAAALDARFESAQLDYEIRRTCLASVILEDTRAAWRLDKPENPHAVGLDAAMLSIQLVAAPDVGPVTAYGAAIGSTRAMWLSAELGSLYAHLRDLLGSLFLKRQPVECRETWTDILE